jgi:hypothetical protein
MECRVYQRTECLIAEVTAQRGGIPPTMLMPALSLKWYILYLSNSKQALRLEKTKLFVWRHVLNADFYHPIKDGCWEWRRSHADKELRYLIWLEALDVRLRQFCFDVISSLRLILSRSQWLSEKLTYSRVSLCFCSSSSFHPYTKPDGRKDFHCFCSIQPRKTGIFLRNTFFVEAICTWKLTQQYLISLLPWNPPWISLNHLCIFRGTCPILLAAEGGSWRTATVRLRGVASVQCSPCHFTWRVLRLHVKVTASLYI